MAASKKKTTIEEVKEKIKPEKIVHVLVPEHIKFSDKEKQDFLDKTGINFFDLPKIDLLDPGISHLDAKIGDVIKIIRHSPTCGETQFFRRVVNE